MISMNLMSYQAIHAQAQPPISPPSWVNGYWTVPFEAVGFIVGMIILGGLLYFAFKYLRSAPEDRAILEQKSRSRATEQTVHK